MYSDVVVGMRELHRRRRRLVDAGKPFIVLQQRRRRTDCTTTRTHARTHRQLLWTCLVSDSVVSEMRYGGGRTATSRAHWRRPRLPYTPARPPGRHSAKRRKIEYRRLEWMDRGVQFWRRAAKCRLHTASVCRPQWSMNRQRRMRRGLASAKDIVTDDDLVVDVVRDCLRLNYEVEN